MDFPMNFKMNRTQMIAAIAIGSIVIAVLYFQFLLLPQVTRVFHAVASSNSISSELNKSKSEISRMGEFSKKIDSYKDKVNSYEKMLPAEQEIPALLENLSTMAKSSNIKIVGITPVETAEGKTQKAGVYQEIPILISAKSGYHELGSFLSHLENSDRFMKVGNISIKSNNATPKKHDIDLLVLTYVLLKVK